MGQKYLLYAVFYLSKPDMGLKIRIEQLYIDIGTEY